jgi:hypothetical protein
MQKELLGIAARNCSSQEGDMPGIRTNNWLLPTCSSPSIPVLSRREVIAGAGAPNFMMEDREGHRRDIRHTWTIAGLEGDMMGLFSSGASSRWDPIASPAPNM